MVDDERVLSDETTCYRHHDRRAAVRCQRCERAICTDCMSQASVGFHCPSCLAESGQKVVRARDVGAGRPPATTAILAVTVAVFLAQNAVVSGRTVELWGLLVGPWVQDGDWWRIVTAGFLHADLLHLGFNMFFLWVLGGSLERGIGAARFVVIYFAGLIGGSLAVLLFNFESAGLGASGAVLGLAGAIVAILRTNGRPLSDTPFGGLLVLNLVLPILSPMISFWAHAGGALFGFVAGWLIVGLPRLFERPERDGTVAAVGLCAVLFAASLILPTALGYS